MKLDKLTMNVREQACIAAWLPVLAVMIGALGLSAADPRPNMLANASFELGDSPRKLPGWSCNPRGAAHAATDTIAKDGERSLRLELSAVKDLVLVQSRRMAVQAGTTYRFSCWVRNHGSRVWFRRNLHGADGRMISKRFKSIIVSNEHHDWKRYEAKIRVLTGEQALSITAFCGGRPGTIWLDKTRLSPVTTRPGEEVQFRLVPGYDMDDNLFHLPLGSPQILMFAVSNESQYQATAPRILVDLPPGIEMLGSLYDATEHAPARTIHVAGKSYTRHDYTMGLAKATLRSVDFSRTSYGAMQLVLRATGTAPANQILEGKIRFVDGDLECRPCSFKLMVTSAVPKARAPRRFRIGADVVAGLDFYEPALTPWADFYKQCGFNEIYVPRVLQVGSTRREFMARDSAPIVQALKKRDVSVVMVSDQLANGYRVRYTGLEGSVPASARILRADGTVTPNTFDPAYIRRRGEWYVRSVHAALDSLVERGADHLWCNWEPYMYKLAKGSFTDLSLQDFAEFAKLSLETVQELGPKGILAEHSATLMRFQNWQYVQAMAVLHELVREYGRKRGRKIELILCTGPDLLAETGENTYFSCFGGAGPLKVFEVPSSWKYVRFDCRELKDPRKRRLIELGWRRDTNRHYGWKPESHRETLDTVEKITRFIRVVTACEKLPKKPYIHLPQNKQSGTWVVWPKAIELQMLAAFIGGADGLNLYFFPQGYDGRYWKSATAANDQIALYEDYLLDGARLEQGFSLTPRTARLQHKDYEKNLTWRAFKHEGKTLLALCNFDPVDPAVFDLSCTGLAKGTYALHDPWRREVLCRSKNQGFSTGDLEKLTLELAPMTIRFFLLEPWRPGRDYGRAVSLSDLKAKAEEKIPALNQSFAAILVEIDELLKAMAVSRVL
ncbi:MAG: hypothetical protein KAI66_18970 [Lentisphaeria bacterium]|nr:hypothetical protein [Lentisphaeria bacterium]